MFQGRRAAGLMRVIENYKHQTVNHQFKPTMIDQNTLDQIELLISSKKVASYKQSNLENWFISYRAELTQAKKFFVYLHFLEIFLRNKIASEFNLDFDEWLIGKSSKFKFNAKEQDKIDQILATLRKAKKDINANNIISNLSLGFWTNLFHRPYAKAWQHNKMIERVFPFLKSPQRSLKQIQKELETIRKFRNRIFHFESLQNCSLEKMEQLIFKFIYGISGVKIWDILQ